MSQTRATRGKSAKGPSTKKHSTTSKAAGSSSSQTGKKSSMTSQSMTGLHFDQFPPALQKQLLKEAQKQAKNDSAAAEKGKYELFIRTEG